MKKPIRTPGLLTSLCALLASAFLFVACGDPEPIAVQPAKKAAGARYSASDVAGQWKLNFVNKPTTIFAYGDPVYGDDWLYLAPTSYSSYFTITNRLPSGSGHTRQDLVNDHYNNGNGLFAWNPTGEVSMTYSFDSATNKLTLYRTWSNPDGGAYAIFREFNVSFNNAKTVMYWSQVNPAPFDKEINWIRYGGGPSVP